jgi:hypothetical protein
LEKIWKEVVVAEFESTIPELPGGTEEKITTLVRIASLWADI